MNWCACYEPGSAFVAYDVKIVDVTRLSWTWQVSFDGPYMNITNDNTQCTYKIFGNHNDM